jgi:hypothetical protein
MYFKKENMRFLQLEKLINKYTNLLNIRRHKQNDPKYHQVMKSLKKSIDKLVSQIEDFEVQYEYVMILNCLFYRIDLGRLKHE